MALMLLAAGSTLVFGQPASAAFKDFALFDGNCDAFSQTQAPLTLDPAFFNNTTIRASKSGVTGVFFIEKGNGTFVLKFEETDKIGIVASRRLFEQLSVPHDAILAEVDGADEVAALYQLARAAALTSRPALTVDEQETLDIRLTSLDRRIQDGDTVPQKALVTQFLPASKAMSSLAAGLRFYTEKFRLSADKQAATADALTGAVDALMVPHNQALIGYLYVADAFLGNQDRLLQTFPNLGNIFVGLGTNGAPCLAAIDNDAFAPTATLAAWLLAAPNKTAQVTWQQQNGQMVEQPEHHVIDKKSRETKKLKLDADKYSDLLFNYFLDTTTTKAWAGPDTAFTGQYEGKDRANLGARLIPPCDSSVPEAKDATTLHWIGRVIRTGLATDVNDSADALRTARFKDAVATSVVENTDSAGLDIVLLRGARADFSEVCTTRVAATYADPAGNAVIYDQTIDWAEFEANFSLGVQLALVDLADLDTTRRLIDTMLNGQLETPYSDVSAEALLARAYYLKYVVEGAQPDKIKRMVLANKKEKFTTAAQIPRMEFLGFNDGRWVPQFP